MKYGHKFRWNDGTTNGKKFNTSSCTGYEQYVYHRHFLIYLFQYLHFLATLFVLINDVPFLVLVITRGEVLFVTFKEEFYRLDKIGYHKTS